MAKQNILDAKRLKYLSIGEGQREQILYLQKHFKVTKRDYGFIKRCITYNIENIVDSYLRRVKCLNENLFPIVSKEARNYIFGEESFKIQEARSINCSLAKTKGLSEIELWFKSVDVINSGITRDNISVRAIVRLELVFNHRDKSIFPVSWKTFLIDFVKNDLTNYIGRLRRLGKMRSKYHTLYYKLLRFGKVESLFKKQCQSDNARISLPSMIEFWQLRGYTREESIELQRQHNLMASKKSAEKTRGTSEYSPRSIVYWLKQGFSEEEAKQKVHEFQTIAWRRLTDEARKKRISDWLNKMNSKTSEEKDLINSKKSMSISGLIVRGYSVEEANQLAIDFYSDRARYSKISQKLFFDVCDKIGFDGIRFAQHRGEKLFSNMSIDFYDELSDTVVEFFGDYWHAREGKYNDDQIVYGDKTASDIRLQDQKRLKKLRENFANVVVIWEGDFVKMPDRITENLYNILIENRKNKL